MTDVQIMVHAIDATKKFYKIQTVIGFNMFKKLLKMAKIWINDTEFSGSSIIVNNKIIIDGVDVTPEGKTINIKIEGDVDKLNVALGKVEITGNVKTVETVSADVSISGNVSGNIESTSGNINCQNITGDVETVSGDVTAAEINGDVETLSGDIKLRK